MPDHQYVPAETEGLRKLRRLIQQAMESRAASQPMQRTRPIQETAKEILARPGAVSSTGMLNPKVISMEEARLIAEANAPAAREEEERYRGRVRTPAETTLRAVGNGP